MSKINQVAPKPLIPTLAPTTVKQDATPENLSGGVQAGQTTTPAKPNTENLISQTESGRQATQANPETSKLVATKSVQGTQPNQHVQQTAPADPVDQVATTSATPFEEIPPAQMSKDEARTELLSLQDKGNIKIEFTDEGKTRLFVPMFNVNFKKETEDKAKSKVRSFLFPKPQDAVKISRFSEWASLKGIKEILFRSFSKPSEADKPAEAAPIVENNAPAPKTQSPTQAVQQPAEKPVQTQTTVPKPASPAPMTQQKIEPQTIPLSRLRTGGTIPLSSSATPIQKPLGTTPKTTMSPMQLAMSQSKAQRDLGQHPISKEQTPTISTGSKDPLQSLTTGQEKVGLVASETLRTDKSQTLIVPEKKPASALSSLGDRLQSLIRTKPSTSQVTKYSSTSTRTKTLLKNRPSLGLWSMDIAGMKGEDPKTGRVIDAHGNRDIIRFNHHSYLHSIRSNRADVAREANQQAAVEKEQQAAAQRADEQQQLRMLLDLEQMRQVENSQQGQPIGSLQDSTNIPPTLDVNPRQEAGQIPRDPSASLLQHQWDESLKKN